MRVYKIRKRATERERKRERERETHTHTHKERGREGERDAHIQCTCNTNTHKQCTYACSRIWNSLLMLNAPFTRPRNLIDTKHLTGNVHAVLMIPSLTHITLGHFVTFLLGQPTRTVKPTDWVFLTPVHLRSPATGKCVRQHCSKQLAKCCLIDQLSNLTLHGSLPLQISYTNAMARTLQSGELHCLPTSIILTTSPNPNPNPNPNPMFSLPLTLSACACTCPFSYDRTLTFSGLTNTTITGVVDGNGTTLPSTIHVDRDQFTLASRCGTHMYLI